MNPAKDECKNKFSIACFLISFLIFGMLVNLFFFPSICMFINSMDGLKYDLMFFGVSFLLEYITLTLLFSDCPFANSAAIDSVPVAVASIM